MRKTAIGQHQYLAWIILLLLLPALFINLGMSPLIADEAIRGLVSFEMQQTGNLITPTISGEYYFNKPPLYNWILLGFFNLFDRHSELILRLPALFSLLIFGWIIYYTTRKELGNRIAFLSSLLFISCGRILFYDSMRGLIDLSFSMVIFLNFYLMYFFISRKKYLSLYLLSYFLASAAFLMKGLPALIFQILTLLTALAYFKSLKKLFHPFHMAGMLVFIFLVGGYYLLLWKNTEEPEFFRNLVTESTKRTLLDNGFWTTIKHLLIFPFSQVYHLLPWSILFIFLIKKSFYDKLRANKYAGYLALVFVVNILAYWTSAGTHPRYLFMLYPIIFILLIYYYTELKTQDSVYRAFWIAMFVFIGLALSTGTAYFFSNSIAGSGKAIVIYSITMIFLLTAYYLLWKHRNIRMEVLIIMLLLLRISFNLLILPDRLVKTAQHKIIEAVENIHEITQNNELMLHHETRVSVEFIYYISTARNEILRKEYGNLKEGRYYIIEANNPLQEGEVKVMEFESRIQKRKLRLSKICLDNEAPQVEK